LTITEPQQVVEACRRIPTLDPYQAGLLYRDVVRFEAQAVAAAVADPVARGKYATYLKRFTRPAPGRYFTDHNYARKLVATLEMIRSPQVRSVLDAACGNGFEAVLFALHRKPVVANDISSARTAVCEARRGIYRQLLGDSFDLTVTCGNAVELAGDRRFDLVYVQEAISHIHPAEQFLAEVRRRLLTSGGRLVICDSNSWNPVTRARITRHLWTTHRTLHYFVEEQVEQDTGRKYLMAEERLFNPVAIVRALRAAGLEPERVVMSGFVPPQLVRSPAPLLARRIDDALSRVPVLKTIGGFYTAIARASTGAPGTFR
jgi:SAM-dependent methyltransferase